MGTAHYLPPGRAPSPVGRYPRQEDCHPPGPPAFATLLLDFTGSLVQPLRANALPGRARLREIYSSFRRSTSTS